jgi:uncharacterized protein YggE
LKAAMDSARRSAEAIAHSVGKKLGQLLEVQYGDKRQTRNPRYWSSHSDAAVDYCKSSFAAQIEPEDIASDETVSVTWQFE